ncbi:sulfate transport system ATP-binding protein [Pseudobutyrivibrio sp. YE44]|uniref:sulfate/molybdate ABC transporter ATP-binding protein n=1 Tax=Pseudobutyrivibrio sp. YE44 TaxID=1520802 RepID=UPI0008913290|nr:ABC transporter ATP-binding protein [Pseudobutyrivibrio sp. YE44]SDB14563.1 sulfate transport system ATP-binding protein [Pseudobutyrivibrio sp. YE44]
MAYVELHDINKHFKKFHASKDINISIEKGKLVALLGPSGSGKTTILRMIAGLENPDSGEIIIDGKVVNNIPGSERGIGFVFQSYALFRYMTVYDNIAFGLRVKKVPENEIKERVNELLELINCQGLEKRYPSQLSGGQRQRVAFARALAPNPQILLLDEPFAAIDAKVRLELRSWLREMITKLNITSIFVTHDQDEAIEVADEIIVTNQGRVEQTGTPQELYKNPATPFVAQFIGNSTEVKNFDQFKYFEKQEATQVAYIRPEFVSIFKKGESVQFQRSAEEAVVEDIIFRGSNLEVKTRLHGNLISAIRSINDPAVEVGEKVFVFIYRLYVVTNDEVTLSINSSIAEEAIVI